MKRNIYIGTSGYSYPHWKKVFYPEDLKQSEWFDFYLKEFNTVEINVTFYRLPPKDMFNRWYPKTPKNFVFALKGSRFITHVKRLKNTTEPLKLFFERTSILKEKLGVVLWQLPPKMKRDTGRLQNFCIELKKLKLKTRYAFEFRDESWLDKETYELLKEHNAAFVISHSSEFPYAEGVTADFVYLRLHGGQFLYGSNYTKTDLKIWARKIREWQNKGLDVFVYFNNDAYGFAVRNAIELRELLGI